MRKYLLFILLAAVFTAGCENSNIFSWTHAKGGDSSPEALLADGQKAEYDGDYEEAIKYYDEILAKDSDNSEALYGKASAELKNAGLDLSEIVPKLLQGDGDAAAAEGLLEGLNLSKLAEGTKNASESLEKIAKGLGDGTIPADDFDVNLNLGVAKTVAAASNLLDWGESEGYVSIGDDYSVEISTIGIDQQVLKNKLVEAKDEVVAAVGYLGVAAAKTGADSQADELKTDLDSMVSDFEDRIAELN